MISRFVQLLFIPLVLALSLLQFPAHGAEYQWSTLVEPSQAAPNNHSRAFLWIPPTCQRVRAVVVGQHNMDEEGILENSCFRQTMSDLGFAIVWVTPSFDAVFRFDQGAGERFEKFMKALAQESGYQELEFAPIVPIGHSAHASYPWNFAAWNPERTLAILSIHGDAPLTNRTGSGRPNPDWGDRNINGVPGLMVMGEFEWGQDRLNPAIAFRQKYPQAPVSVLADVGHGHFDTSAQMISYLGLFLRKAAAVRLPADAPLDGPVKLKAVDPKKGWLVDQWRKGQPRQAPAAPYAEYKGDPAQAFWSFDQETALANERFNFQGTRKPQLLGMEQEGQVIAQVPNTHFQVPIKFLPLEDGISFKLKGTFIDSVPEGGNPVKWTGLPAGSAIGHALGGGPVVISRICGPVIQTGLDTWSIHFYRGSNVMDPSKTKDGIWLLASHEGDDQFKSAVQQALLNIPMRNAEGAEQHITFPEIPSQTNQTAFIDLQAKSDANVPVYFYVREGPAEVEGNRLRFTPVPPRAKYPVKVTVVAWQWGRTIEPKLKSAQPVEHEFAITK